VHCYDLIKRLSARHSAAAFCAIPYHAVMPQSGTICWGVEVGIDACMQLTQSLQLQPLQVFAVWPVVHHSLC
jgi:hypothetical protein